MEKPQRPQRKLRNDYSSDLYPHKEITGKVISCALEVHSILGPGLLESIYEEALELEFKSQDLKYHRQKKIEIEYKGSSVGDYRLDFLIENKVVVELKCVDAITGIHVAQILTYLKAENLQIGLLINFNVAKLRDGIKRIII